VLGLAVDGAAIAAAILAACASSSARPAAARRTRRGPAAAKLDGDHRTPELVHQTAQFVRAFLHDRATHGGAA
jgi:hypothetical protein